MENLIMMKRYVAPCIIISTITPAIAQPRAIGPSIFSNRSNGSSENPRDTSDHGMSVMILIGGKTGHLVLFQSFDTPSFGPLLVEAKWDGNTFSFTIPGTNDNPGPGTFRGSPYTTELVGSFDRNPGKVIHLPRSSRFQ
jgi:hypothetical protein